MIPGTTDLRSARTAVWTAIIGTVFIAAGAFWLSFTSLAQGWAGCFPPYLILIGWRIKLRVLEILFFPGKLTSRHRFCFSQFLLD